MTAGFRRAMEVAPRVYLLRRVRGCNVYYLADPENPTLIDAGLPWGGRALVDAVGEVQPQGPTPRWLLLTHYHIDHAGGAEKVRRAFGTSIATHRAEAEAFVHRRLSGALLPWHVRRYTARTRPDRLLEDGAVLPVLGGLEVLHTPGHTPGSLSFYLPASQALFSGDQFVSYQDRLSRTFMGRESDVEAYRSSLDRLAALRPAVLLPGHGYPVLRDATELLTELAARRGSSAGWRARLRNVPRLVRFTLGMWRDADLPRAGG